MNKKSRKKTNKYLKEISLLKSDLSKCKRLLRSNARKHRSRKTYFSRRR